MKKMILPFLLLLLVAGNIYSQTTIEPTFISIKNKYEFTLPQFDVSLPLPANAQFQVPRFSGRDILLEVNDITCYYFHLSYLERTDRFTFLFTVASQNADEILRMNIIEQDAAGIIQKIDEAVSNGIVKRIPGIKTKLGETVSYQMEEELETHVITKGEYAFAFTLNSQMNKKLKQQYLNIIKKFKEKQQPYLKVRYETKAANGEFKPKKEEVKPIIIKSEENKGKLAGDMFFEWPDLGYGIKIPENWEYQIDGELAPLQDDHVKLLFDKSFLESDFMTMSWFRNDEVSVLFRSYRKINPLDMINNQIKNTKHTQTVDLLVDGIPLKGYFYGSKEFGSLDFCFEAQNAHHWVSFSSVSKNTLALLQELLSTMKIEGIQQTDKKATTAVPDLNTQLKLKDLSPVKIDMPLELTDNWPAEELFDCELIDLGIHIKLPGKESDYLYMTGNSRESIKNGVIKGVPLNDSDKRLSVFSLASSPISCSISKKAPIESNEKYIKDFKRGWSVYKEWEFVHGSIANANELEWRVCITKYADSYTSMLSTDIDGLEIFISITTPSKEEALKCVSYLKNISYR